MKANELRLGNLVKIHGCDVDYHICTVESIMIDEVSLKIIGDGEEWLSIYQQKLITHIEPIPITEELLLKFGFENGIDEMTFYNNLICIYWKKFDNYFEINGENYFITELHMFQNLYWALCGEELTIKN